MGRWLDRLAELQAADAAGEREHREQGNEASERPSRLLRLVHHDHRCRCGRAFPCTAPSCAGRMIPCVVCRIDGRTR